MQYKNKERNEKAREKYIQIKKEERAETARFKEELKNKSKYKQLQ